MSRLLPSTPRARVLAAAAIAWTAMGAPAWAYVDPTAAGAFIQSLYVLMASAVFFVLALPHKISAAVQAVRTKLRGGRPEQEP